MALWLLILCTISDLLGSQAKQKSYYFEIFPLVASSLHQNKAPCGLLWSIHVNIVYF